MKENTDEAVKDTPSIEHVLVVRRTETEVPWTDGRDVWWHDVVGQAVGRAHRRGVRRRAPALHPLHLRHHREAEGHPAHLGRLPSPRPSYTHHAVFDHKPGESVYWCTADIGWVTGHSYIVYGPLANGATSDHVRGHPEHPARGPALGDHPEIRRLHLLHRAHPDPHVHEVGCKEIPDKYDLTSLKVLGSVGESINPEAWMWYREHVGHNNCPIVDNLVADRDRRDDDRPTARRDHDEARARRCARCPGIGATIVDESGTPVKPTARAATWCSTSRGRRCCAVSGATRSATEETYWSRFAEQGYYFAGDGAKYDNDGAIWLLGRVDDVMNVSGHRISTTEVESALVSHPTVAEAAVVGGGGRDHRSGHRRVRHPARQRRQGRGRGGDHGAARPRVQGNRADRQAEEDPGRRGTAQDQVRQDHAAAVEGQSRRTARSATSRRWPTPP